MRWKGAILAATLATLGTHVPQTAHAVPIGPPTVSVYPGRWGSLDTAIVGTADDPDGHILSLEVCIETAGCVATQPPRGEDLDACVSGDDATLWVEHTFPDWGTYDVLVRATGASCLGLLPPETVERTFTVTLEEIVPPPSAPPIEIPCVGDGDRTASDVGVTADTIMLGIVAPESPSFAGWSEDGFVGAVASINAGGGVCGRDLVLSQGPEQPYEGIRGLDEALDADLFALVGIHLSEIDDASAHIDDAQMPIIGTGGRAELERTSPLLWSIGSSEDTIADVLVDDAIAEGAVSFGVVYDDRDPYAQRVAAAIEEEVATHAGASVAILQPLLPGQASYSSEIARFNQACVNGCDAVIPLLSRNTFLTWTAGRPRPATIRASLWPELFSETVARNCAARCRGMLAWSPFLAPAGSDSEASDLYRDSVRSRSPTAELDNTQTLLGYEAVLHAAFAMGQAGPNLTRAGVQTILDTESYDLGLTATPMTWSPSRDANRSLRGYEIVTGQGSFLGFRNATGWRSADD